MSAVPAAAPPHAEARFAGLVYLIVVVTGLFSLAWAPDRIFVGETPEAIAANVAAQASLFRASIAAELVCYVAFLVLALALRRLLEPAGAFTAALMAALVFASVPLAVVNVMNQLATLRAAEAGAADAAAAAHQAYKDGMLLLKIFWGGWLIPFGWLVIRCSFLPWILGVILILAGVGYIADFAGQLLFADAYAESGLGRYFRMPRLGEILITFWLLLFGARRTLIPAKR